MERYLKVAKIPDVNLAFGNITKKDNDEYKNYYDLQSSDLLIKKF